MANNTLIYNHHDKKMLGELGGYDITSHETKFTYTFENFFHPFVGKLVQQLNRESLEGLLDPVWLDTLKLESLTGDPAKKDPEQFDQEWKDSVEDTEGRNYFKDAYSPTQDDKKTEVIYFPKEVDLSSSGPYANYNWELLFHIPFTIAVHLSKNQRFAEAQRWFHYIFDPTSPETKSPRQQPFWKFLGFAFPKSGESKTVEEIVRILSSPDQEKAQAEIWQGYLDILKKPFKPHAVARTRPLAYQYSVVMKYLDNLIAWGDSLFQQDTVESINEATQQYVLAANILGPKPERIPPMGKVKPKTFKDLKDGLGEIGDALVDLEGQFPFNLGATSRGTGGKADGGALFGMGRTLYFCIPKNDKLLSYWDTVADRLFKIRHGMNLAGVVRPLALFDPPIDPGMLVKAAAAGIDIGSIVSGLNKPVGPVRSLFLIQKAIELASEVRSLGGALLSALEKGDAEHLAAIRQRHEVQVQQMAQEVRYLQWKAAQEGTKSLLTSRATALERLRYYQRLLGLPADPNAPDAITLDHRELTEENFDEAFNSLIGQYDKQLTVQKMSALKLAGNASPSQQSGASGSGQLYLNTNEDADLNIHSPNAKEDQEIAWVMRHAAPILGLIPQIPIHIAYWGLGGEIQFGGEQLSKAAIFGAELFEFKATLENHAAASASKTASFQRRADDWLLQYNLAAHEVMQNGRQILTSLIAEQIAHHEYQNTLKQIKNSQEIDHFLQDKFTNQDLYLWMQGEISRLYYEYYRFAVDTAKRAEQAMKRELMRPELDNQDFVKFNYWDGGRKGLLSGEALHLDLKRMEMAYHDNNKRELELTRHISLRQLDPLALLALRATGSCQVTVPEWLYDLDCPGGHYLRRIKQVSLSIPSVVGPYTSVNCTLSLLSSTIRVSPVGEYLRQEDDDPRFLTYTGAIQSIVTSSAQNDSGLFETNLRDDRILPFEGAGAISTWKLDLPKAYPSFDHSTISDVILHIRYTARQGVAPGHVTAALDEIFSVSDNTELALLLSVRQEFSSAWSAFTADTNSPLTLPISRDRFPYFTQGRNITAGTPIVFNTINFNKRKTLGVVGEIGVEEFNLEIAKDKIPDYTPNASIYVVMPYSLS